MDIYILDYIQYMDELKGKEWCSGNENRPEAGKGIETCVPIPFLSFYIF